MGETIYVVECNRGKINKDKSRELIKQDGGDGDDRKEDNVATKDQAIKTIEILNRSKQNVTKQYKTKDETEPREQKQQSKTISDRAKKETLDRTPK